MWVVLFFSFDLFMDVLESTSVQEIWKFPRTDLDQSLIRLSGFHVFFISIRKV